MATLQTGDICVIEARLNGAWSSSYYLATIVAFEEDAQDNWLISKVKLIGEWTIRECESDNAIVGYSRIWQDDKQKQVSKLAATFNEVRAFASLDELRNRISEIW